MQILIKITTTQIWIGRRIEDNVVIVKTDKGNGLTLMIHSHYLERVHSFLQTSGVLIASELTHLPPKRHPRSPPI